MESTLESLKDDLNSVYLAFGELYAKIMNDEISLEEAKIASKKLSVILKNTEKAINSIRESI